MTLVHPAALLLLALIPVAWFWPRRPRRTSEGVTRSLALVFVVLALARPVQRTDDVPPHVVRIVDASESAERFEEAELALPEEARVTRLELEGERSPLGDALARAAAAVPDGTPGAVVLESDGLATERGWTRAVQDLAARGLPVHVAPRGRAARDLRPVGLATRGELRVGRTARVAAVVAGEAEEVELRLVGPDGELARAVASVSGRAEVELAFEPDEPGWMRVVLEVAGADARPGNETLARVLPVQDPLRVLYVGRHARGGAERLEELLGAGFEIESGEPDDAALAASDLVWIDDRTAEGVDPARQDALAAAVRERGLGLVMSGANAFGPGGWHDTPVMDVLPVEAVQKEEKRDPSTTLVVIIDTSGSMGGNRVQLAKEVARLAIQRLLPHDKVGIVEFYGAKRWAAPIQPASNRIELERALNRLNAGGGTVILPAIEEAFYGLQNVQTRYQHVLVLTDGGVERGAFEGLIRRMADEGITVSTVLIGPDAHSEFLVSIANWGKGRFYAVPNRFNLPELLLKQPTSAKLPAWRSGEHTVRARGGASWWGTVDPTAVPPLGGYVETRARPGSQVLLETERGAHPIVATWRPGLGRATAVTTGPASRGTEPWREWEGYGAALARILARTASDVRAPYAWSVERRGHEVVVVAERARHPAPVPSARLADGTAVALRERAPGRFEGAVAYRPDRPARIVGFAGGVTTRLAVPSAPPETQVDPARGLDPTALATATGGRVLGAASDRTTLTVGGGDAPVGLRDRRTACLLLALLAYLGNLLARRWPA